ncbi:MAG: hypothetical protein NTY34_03890 [Candidatus Omnitrophica bacterium]|nr:hypothetical protein [Candidatus Omnitrophota bacterium]
MAKERFATPEKQLLSLIEDRPAKKGDARGSVIKHRGLSFLSPGAWMGRLSFLKQNLKAWHPGDIHSIDLRGINRILVVVIAILAVYFVQRIGMDLMRFNKMSALQLGSIGAQSMAEIKNIAGLNKALSNYTEIVSQRDIFNIGSIKQPPTPMAPSAVSKAVEATQRLKLVGISWSGDPEVMIEDEAALRTFFVKRGQMVGPVKVQAVFKDKVILSYEGEEIELK